MIKKINSKFQHLGQVTDKLPANCIYDKGKVGCGGTSVALESDIPYVVAVPFQSLIENKVSQYPGERYDGEVFGVMGGVLKTDVDEYIERTYEAGFPPKFIVTYDSLDRLTRWINPSEYNILIDEMHILFTAYSYRYRAAQIVLEEYKKYNEFCFMTATVLEKDFMLDELMDIPVKSTEWEDVKEVNLFSIKCENDVSSTVAHLIKEFLNGEKAGNAYFFVNSVEFIKEMVQYCELTDDTARAIYSKNNKTEVGISRGNTYDAPKKINFVTSTAFEGADIYDTEGRIFIISDNRKMHTLTDISTSAQQIAGRIRNTKYWEDIYHLYTNTRYDVGQTYDQFRDGTVKAIEEAKESVAELNSLSEKAREMIKSVANEHYINIRDKKFIFDANLVKIDLYNFKVTKCLYKLRVNVQKEYEKYGFKVTNGTHKAFEIVRMDKVDDKNFEQVVTEIEEEVEANEFSLHREDLIAAASIKYPFLREAIDKIGFDGLRDLKYVITNVKFRLSALSDRGVENKILRMLKNKMDLGIGDFQTSARIKKVFQEIYKELNISKKGKGTDIKMYFEVRETVRTQTVKVRGEDVKKSVKGFVVVRNKIMLK